MCVFFVLFLHSSLFVILAYVLFLGSSLEMMFFYVSLYFMIFILIISPLIFFIPSSFLLPVGANGIYFAIWITESFFSSINLALFCFCDGIIRFLKHYFLYINQFSSHQQVCVYINTTGSAKQLLSEVCFYFLSVFFKSMSSLKSPKCLVLLQFLCLESLSQVANFVCSFPPVQLAFAQKMIHNARECAMK